MSNPIKIDHQANRWFSQSASALLFFITGFSLFSIASTALVSSTQPATAILREYSGALYAIAIALLIITSLLPQRSLKSNQLRFGIEAVNAFIAVFILTPLFFFCTKKLEQGKQGLTVGILATVAVTASLLYIATAAGALSPSNDNYFISIASVSIMITASCLKLIMNIRRRNAIFY